MHFASSFLKERGNKATGTWKERRGSEGNSDGRWERTERENEEIAGGEGIEEGWREKRAERG